jgi:hypothetical protein
MARGQSKSLVHTAKKAVAKELILVAHQRVAPNITPDHEHGTILVGNATACYES